MAKFKRNEPEEAVKAHCVQFGALYLFDANYKVSVKGKALTGIQHFYNFITVYLWDIRVKDVSSGDGVTLKRRPVNDPVLELKKKINDHKNSNFIL